MHVVGFVLETDHLVGGHIAHSPAAAVVQKHKKLLY